MSPWLSFWTSPLLVSQSNGNTVVMCTIDGLKPVTLAPQGNHVASLSAVDICSALQLLDALNASALPSLTAWHTLVPKTPLDRSVNTYIHQVPHLSVYSSRAPPLSLSS